MSRREQSIWGRINTLAQAIKFSIRLLIDYGSLLIGGFLLLYAVIGNRFVSFVVAIVSGTVSDFADIGMVRIGSAVIAIVFIVIGYSTPNFNRRRRFVVTMGLLALVAVPAVLVLLGQIVLSNTELQLVANAFQSAGSLLLVILTLSYVVATRSMNQSNWEMIYDQRKDHYRPIAKRLITDCLDPLRKNLAEQESIMIAARNKRIQPLPTEIETHDDLFEDMFSIEYLKEAHQRYIRFVKRYDIESIGTDVRRYYRNQTTYNRLYEIILEEVIESLYYMPTRDERPMELTDEEERIIQYRTKELAGYLLRNYPDWQIEIKRDRELALVYPKLKAERQYFLQQSEERIERFANTAEEMYEISRELLSSPGKIREWRQYLMDDYYIGESEL